MTDSWMQSRDAQIAALEAKVRELEEKLAGAELPVERGFIITGRFDEELFHEQADWLTEIESAAGNYATITYSSLIEAKTSKSYPRPGEMSITFTPSEWLDYEEG